MRDIIKSFYIVGNSEQDITAIFSPVWHRYEEADGMLLSGSVTLKSAQASVVKCDELKVLYNQVIPTGSNATAFSKEEKEASQGDELNPENRDRNRLARRKLIREYFEWVRDQKLCSPGLVYFRRQPCAATTSAAPNRRPWLPGANRMCSPGPAQ